MVRLIEHKARTGARYVGADGPKGSTSPAKSMPPGTTRQTPDGDRPMPDETLTLLMSVQDKIAVAMHRIMSEPGHDVSVAAGLSLANRELLNAIKAAGGKLA